MVQAPSQRHSEYDGVIATLTHRQHVTQDFATQLLSVCVLQIYRTPFMLRYCCSILIHIGAVVLGPYFVHIGERSLSQFVGDGCNFSAFLTNTGVSPAVEHAMQRSAVCVLDLPTTI
jgi:hypothetical protein